MNKLSNAMAFDRIIVFRYVTGNQLLLSLILLLSSNVSCAISLDYLSPALAWGGAKQNTAIPHSLKLVEIHLILTLVTITHCLETVKC